MNLLFKPVSNKISYFPFFPFIVLYCWWLDVSFVNWFVCYLWNGSLFGWSQSALHSLVCPSCVRIVTPHRLGCNCRLVSVCLHSWLWRYKDIHLIDRLVTLIHFLHIIEIFETGFLQRMLSWNCFVPLARICYAVFLVHFAFVKAYTSQLRKPLYFTEFNFIANYVGTVAFVFFVAATLCVAIEIPFHNLDKLIFPNKSKPTPPAVDNARGKNKI